MSSNKKLPQKTQLMIQNFQRAAIHYHKSQNFQNYYFDVEYVMLCNQFTLN